MNSLRTIGYRYKVVRYGGYPQKYPGCTGNRTLRNTILDKLGKHQAICLKQHNTSSEHKATLQFATHVSENACLGLNSVGQLTNLTCFAEWEKWKLSFRQVMVYLLRIPSVVGKRPVASKGDKVTKTRFRLARFRERVIRSEGCTVHVGCRAACDTLTFVEKPNRLLLGCSSIRGARGQYRTSPERNTDGTNAMNREAELKEEDAPYERQHGGCQLRDAVVISILPSESVISRRPSRRRCFSRG